MPGCRTVFLLALNGGNKYYHLVLEQWFPREPLAHAGPRCRGFFGFAVPGGDALREGEPQRLGHWPFFYF